MEQNNNEEERVVYNYSYFKIKFMANLLINASNAFIRGDVLGWYSYLRAIKNCIKSRLSKKEIKLLNDFENTIGEILSLRSYNKDFNESEKQIKDKKVINQACKYIDTYDTILNRILESKGYGDQLKTDESKLYGDE